MEVKMVALYLASCVDKVLQLRSGLKNIKFVNHMNFEYVGSMNTLSAELI
jgi:hypothetical protein